MWIYPLRFNCGNDAFFYDLSYLPGSPFSYNSPVGVIKNRWIFEHLPIESLVHSEREIDIIGKFTFHMQIYGEKRSEGT
jgi:hypothetical protein